jgi:putative ABC transport system permease protein
VATSAAMSEAIEQELRSRFTVAPEDRSAIYVSNTLEEAEKIYGLIDTIRLVFWFIGIGTIIAGIVGVSNIMLIIVKERTKEIGIRKALGALPSQITGMILQEAIFITAISGLIGLLAGVFALEVLSPLVETDFLKHPKADLGTSLTTLVILIVAGALAGFIPARRAAHIKPIEALRDE